MANVSHLNKTVATDTFFFDIPALGDGIMGHGVIVSSLQFILWKNESEMAGTLEDLIHFHGAPNALFSENAKAKIGCAVQEILRMYSIKDF
jgi:hypothetical protein